MTNISRANERRNSAVSCNRNGWSIEFASDDLKKELDIEFKASKARHNFINDLTQVEKNRDIYIKAFAGGDDPFLSSPPNTTQLGCTQSRLLCKLKFVLVNVRIEP